MMIFMIIIIALLGGTHVYTVCLSFCSIPQKPLVLVLHVSKALVIIPFSSEQLLVVEYAVELPMQRCVIVHATNEHNM